MQQQQQQEQQLLLLLVYQKQQQRNKWRVMIIRLIVGVLIREGARYRKAIDRRR